MLCVHLQTPNIMNTMAEKSQPVFADHGYGERSVARELGDAQGVVQAHLEVGVDIVVAPAPNFEGPCQPLCRFRERIAECDRCEGQVRSLNSLACSNEGRGYLLGYACQSGNPQNQAKIARLPSGAVLRGMAPLARCIPL